MQQCEGIECDLGNKVMEDLAKYLELSQIVEMGLHLAAKLLSVPMERDACWVGSAGVNQYLASRDKVLMMMW